MCLSIGFKLQFHNDPKKMRGFALVSSGKPRMTVSPPFTPVPVELHPVGTAPRFYLDKDGFTIVPTGTSGIYMRPPQNGVRKLSSGHENMDSVATFFGSILQQPVVNETGLVDFYDFHLFFAPDGANPSNGPEAGAPDAVAADPAPSLIQAVKLQLGLDLVSKMVPVDVFVIDHLERNPVEN